MARFERDRQGNLREKGVDVLLAIDLVRMAAEDRYDVAIVLSGDGDLVHCLSLLFSPGDTPGRMVRHERTLVITCGAPALTRAAFYHAGAGAPTRCAVSGSWLRASKASGHASWACRAFGCILTQDEPGNRGDVLAAAGAKPPMVRLRWGIGDRRRRRELAETARVARRQECQRSFE